MFQSILKVELLEYEYFYALGIMEEKDDVHDIFQRQFFTNLERLRLASKFVQNFAIASISLDSGLRPVMHVRQIIALRRYCTSDWLFCLQPVVEDEPMPCPFSNSPIVEKIAQLLRH